MGVYEIFIGIVGAAVIAAVGTGIEWMPRYLKRSTTNWKLGVSHEPELRGELVKAFVIVWLCRAVQLWLIGLVTFTKPSGIAWIPIVLLFVLSLMAYFPADKMRRSLLA
jgi:hypothetical protein